MESHHPHNPQPQQPQNLATPIAIVVAGILVAGAVIFTNKGTEGAPLPIGANGAPVKTAMLPVTDIAKAAGVDKSKFVACLTNEAMNARVDSDLKAGISEGVQGTPASFITHKNGRIEMLGGALPFENIKAILDSMKTDTKAKKDQKAYPATLTTIKATDHVLGNPNAPIVIFEYSDFQCPFCKRFHPTVKQVMEQYGKSGEVALVYRHFPLEQIHPQARPLAIATECAAELGGNDAFWKAHDLIMSTNGDFNLSAK